MKQLKMSAAFISTVIIMISCQKQADLIPKSEATKSNDVSINRTENKEESFGGGNKHVYTLSNQVSANAVMDYQRATNGTLTFSASYPTGGTGTGGGLGNQGAIALDENGEILLAVNPGSNSISLFNITENGLTLRSTVSSGGMRPVSITMENDIVYVLNAGGTGNISGFRLNNNMLIAIANSTSPLSSASSGAAQVSFVNEGKVLVVTEKATNKIITYTVNASGVPGMMHSINSSTATPFGFDAGNNGNIFVSEAAGGAAGASKLSSYHVNNDGSISLLTGSVGANQSAACWVVITNNGKYAYTTNTASNNLSNFDINNASGAISVNTAIAATTGMGPIDAALSNNSKYLYVLNSGSHSIGVYMVDNNGSLSNIQTVSGVPAGATGLAAR
ncbi:MAG: beta-propeller fold lactonase family protein [Ferruginibacter sp.]